ncbi:hypothetical protein LMG7974_01588 [Campylobacter majalis]|uniref:Uncharacterized protein n=1 Tax=Campylobacter majalis TaxID=2790656 RepID=A0ABM8Q9C1_9BACT|nr:hypothetical protein [Campylobacter majalis]CAD7289511.1 hypothetical protein LMG7974_01588 [Campylobacter majalis]
MQNIDENKYIWIPMKAYCKIKNITRKTCWQQRKDGKIIAKVDAGKKVFIAIEKNSCFINNKNEYFIFSSQFEK